MTETFDNEFQGVVSVMADVIKEYDDLATKTRAILQEKMKILFDKFFETHPQVNTIYWVQYTPYFNDGDECIFRVGDVSFSTTVWNDIERSYEEDDEGAILHRGRYECIDGNWTHIPFVYEDDPTLGMDMMSLESILSKNTNKEVVLAMFGDHVFVRAHRGGFEIDDFEHE